MVKVELLGKPWHPETILAQEILKENGIPFSYYEYNGLILDQKLPILSVYKDREMLYDYVGNLNPRVIKGIREVLYCEQNLLG